MNGHELYAMWRESCGEELGDRQMGWWHLQHAERMSWTRMADKIAEEEQLRANDILGPAGRV